MPYFTMATQAYASGGAISSIKIDFTRAHILKASMQLSGDSGTSLGADAEDFLAAVEVDGVGVVLSTGVINSWVGCTTSGLHSKIILQQIDKILLTKSLDFSVAMLVVRCIFFSSNKSRMTVSRHSNKVRRPVGASASVHRIRIKVRHEDKRHLSSRS